MARPALAPRPRFAVQATPGTWEERPGSDLASEKLSGQWGRAQQLFPSKEIQSLELVGVAMGGEGERRTEQ